MDYPEVFNNYDIRGTCPGQINEKFATMFGCAVGTYAKGRVVVGGDTRSTTPAIKRALCDGIRSCGIDVIDVGCGPTDLVAIAGGIYGAKLSVMVTASHHPWASNGFKLMYPKGNGLSNEDLGTIKDIYVSRKFLTADLGAYEKKEKETKEMYCAMASSCFRKRFRPIDARVVVDCSNGAASGIAPGLLESLGATVIRVNCASKPDESIDPEPREKNRNYLIDALKDSGASLAVGFDIDADRVFAFDSGGRWLNGNEIFTVVAKALGSKKIAASLDTSELISEATGAQVMLTRVGDIFVSRKAIDEGADFSGEPNGHYAFPEFSWYNSGIFAALVLCAKSKEIPEIVSALPKYFSLSKNFTYGTDAEKSFKAKEIIKKAREKYEIISDIDGVKFRCAGSTVLIRPSGTKPLIRITVEGKDEKEVMAALDEACGII